MLRLSGTDGFAWQVAISGGADGLYEVEPQKELRIAAGQEYELSWPSGYTETVMEWLVGMHEAGTVPPYLLKRSRPDEPHPDCDHPWISTDGDLGGPATGKCHQCGGQTRGASAKDAVEAFGVNSLDYSVTPTDGAKLVGITNGPYVFRCKVGT